MGMAGDSTQEITSLPCPRRPMARDRYCTGLLWGLCHIPGHNKHVFLLIWGYLFPWDRTWPPSYCRGQLSKNAPLLSPGQRTVGVFSVAQKAGRFKTRSSTCVSAEERALLLLPDSVDRRTGSTGDETPSDLRVVLSCAGMGLFFQSTNTLSPFGPRALFSGLDCPLLTFGSGEVLVLGCPVHGGR